MSEESYNGWSNYQTWAVGMFLDGNYTGEGTYHAVRELVRDVADAADDAGQGGHVYDVAEALKDWFEEMLPELDGIASDLLGSAVDRVNWRELAENKLSEIAEG